MTDRSNEGIILSTMEVRFHDPSDSPRPPSETRIRSVDAEPWPDNRRVSVTVRISPFLERPDLTVTILDVQGREVASAGAIQLRQAQVEVTLHLRHSETSGQYTVRVCLVYPNHDLEQVVVDRSEATFAIP